MAQKLVVPSRQLKQLIQIGHKHCKDPNWLETNHRETNPAQWSERDSNPGPLDYESGVLTSRHTASFYRFLWCIPSNLGSISDPDADHPKGTHP